MYKITAWNVLLREQTELPAGLEVTTDRFGDGWECVQAGDTERFKAEIQARGWGFHMHTGGLLGNGVDDTSQRAIASALKVVLCHVGQGYNAVEVEHIELTQYPWFFLARVGVCPYLIQPDGAMPAAEIIRDIQVNRSTMRLPRQPDMLYPQFGSAMPTVKEMLVLSRSVQGMPR